MKRNGIADVFAGMHRSSYAPHITKIEITATQTMKDVFPLEILNMNPAEAIEITTIRGERVREE